MPLIDPRTFPDPGQAPAEAARLHALAAASLAATTVQVATTLDVEIRQALGTLLMPGLGTGAGASVGGRIDESLNKAFGK